MLLLTPDESRFAQQESDKIGGLGRYLQRVWPYRFILAQAIAINIAIGLLSLASPFNNKQYLLSLPEDNAP
jgi:ABC-type bacteriocin/lantibiotic exporter with double-glycine peptidase domain